MSGNQESRVRLPTWRCSDFNAAIPIKKRKYLVQAVEEAETSVGRSGGLDSSSPGSRTNVGGEPVPSLPSVSVGNGDKAGGIENMNIDQIRVKVEEPNFPIPSSSLAGSVGKLPVTAEHPGADITGVRAEQTVLKTHDSDKEPCGKDNLRGECQTEGSSGASAVSMLVDCKTKNTSPLWRKEESTSLNLSLSKGVCAPHNTDSVPICTKSGNHSGVSRSNWDLNTTMDAWGDDVDRKTRVKTSGAFSNSNRSLPGLEPSSCRDTSVIAKSVSEKDKESVELKSSAVILSQFDHQVMPTCSLSLGLSSYPSIEKSPSLPPARSEARAGPSGNVNSVNLRTVKSEIIEESVRQETDNAQVFPIGLSISGVKQEAAGRFRQGNSPSTSILKPANTVPIKTEPHNFTQFEVFNRKDETLNHPHTQIMLSHENLDLPTSTPHQKDQYIPSSNVTSLTEERILNDRKTSISKDIPHKSLGTDEVSVSHEEKGILSGKDLEEKLHRYGFESDCGHNLSREIKKQVGNGNLYDEEKVQGPAAISAEGNEIAHAECGGSETEQKGIDVPFHGDFGNSNHVEEKGSQPALLGDTVEMASTEVQIERLTPELQSGIFDGSAENEGRIVHDSEQSTHQIFHTSDGMSEYSTIDNDPTTGEFSEGSQNRIINLAQVSNKSPNKILDASGSFALRMERERLLDLSREPRKYLSRGSDESCKFSRERYHGKIMRSPSFMPDRRRFSDQTEGNMHDRDTKNFEFNNHGNTRRGGRGGAFNSNFRRGRRPPNDEGTPFSHSFPRRPPTFSFTHRGTRNKEDTSAFPGYREGENATRGSQCNNTEQMFTSPQHPYRGRNSYFARGQTKFLNAPKRDFPGYRSRSPTRSRERSPGPSSSFRNRSQDEFGGNTEFSHRRSPSGYRMEKISSPDHSGYSRENASRRHSSPSYSHRPSNTGRGRGYARGRGYVRGRGYGRTGFPFRNPSDRIIHRNHGNLNNLDPRERVNYNDDFFEGPNHSERFGVDVNVERRRFGYRHDGTSSFRPSFNNDGCAPTNVENDPDAVRLGQDPYTEIEERGSLMETDGKNNDLIENESDTFKNMAEEETSKPSENWQRDELGGGDGF